MGRKSFAGLFAASAVAVAAAVSAQPVEVTLANFVRAETDHYMAKYAAQGALGRLLHVRQPVSVAEQDVIRMNRDTIYSGGMFDLSEPVTITLPAGDGRFQSMQVINQDHYTVAVEHDPGRYTLTREQVGTRYAAVLIRTFMDPNDADDVARANALQDQIEVQQAAPGACLPFRAAGDRHQPARRRRRAASRHLLRAHEPDPVPDRRDQGCHPDDSSQQTSCRPHLPPPDPSCNVHNNWCDETQPPGLHHCVV